MKKLVAAVMAVVLVLGMATAQAADLTWDHNADGAASDGAGTWLNANQWLDGGVPATWNNTTPDNATIGSGGNGGTLTVGGVTAGTVTLDNFNGTYWLSGGSITSSGGITLGTTAGTVSMSTQLHGAGGITHNSPGTLILSHTPSTYTGDFVINDGIVQFGTGYSDSWLNTPQHANLEINDGIMAMWYYGSKDLGTGTNEIQLTGGKCGFNMLQGDAAGVLWTINGTDGYEVQWGTNTFNPSTLSLNDADYDSAIYVRFVNKLDLNGANRTIGAGHATNYGQMEGIIRNSSGTPAGIIKTGIGELRLTAANEFDGPVEIQEGSLRVTALANGGANSQIGASSADATNLVLSGGTLLYAGSGHSSDRGLSFDAGGGTLSASGTGALTLTSTNNPGWGTVDQPRTVTLGGTSFANNTLAAHIADNGTGVVSLSKTGTGAWTLTGTNTYSGSNTVSAGFLIASSTDSLSGWDDTGNVIFDGGAVTVPVGAFATNDIDTLLSKATKNSGAIGFDTTAGGDVSQWKVFSAAWLGPLGIAKFGSNTLTLDQANDYVGATYVAGGTLALSNDNAVGSSSGVTMLGGALVVGANCSISNLILDARSCTVSGSGVLAFHAGGVIDDEWFDVNNSAADTSTISCGISGSPKVETTKSQTQPVGTGLNTLRFEPSGNSTQALGDIEFNHPGGSQASLIILAGSSNSTENTLGSVYKVAAHSYNQHLWVEGPAKWTLNGNIGKSTDVNPVVWRVDGGTLIVNGSAVDKPYLTHVENGRLGGNLTYGTTAQYLPTDGTQIRGGGILSPGDGGIGKMSFSWGSSGAVREFDFLDDSVYEFEVSGTTNDLVEVVFDIGVGGVAFNLDIDNFVLKIQDASAGEYVEARNMPVFTYSADVTVDLTGFNNDAANFDTTALGAGWKVNNPSLTDDSAGTIYLTGISKPAPSGSILLVR